MCKYIYTIEESIYSIYTVFSCKPAVSVKMLLYANCHTTEHKHAQFDNDPLNQTHWLKMETTQPDKVNRLYLKSP